MVNPQQESVGERQNTIRNKVEEGAQTLPNDEIFHIFIADYSINWQPVVGEGGGQELPPSHRRGETTGYACCCGTNPSGVCAPSPKKKASICFSRKERDLGSIGDRRYSLISIV